jgi:Zn-dependent protease with chaperone function
MSRLRGVVTGHAGVVWQAGSIAFAIAALVAAVLIGRRVVQGVLRLRSVSGGHARAARIVGRAATERPDVVILEAPERAAYCVAGRPHAIVVTSAALGVLDPAQLDAVLAHERAHLTGWHPQILAALRALAASLPRIPLFTVGCAEVARLLEMCADDAAAVRHGRRTLLSGLIALVGDPAVPAPAVGATSTAVLARAVRLASPPPSAVRARSRLVLAATIAVIAAAPAVAGLLAASGVLLCDLTAM